MQQLSSDDARVITDLLIGNVPHVVLDLICHAPAGGITGGSLAHSIVRYLPSTVDPAEVREHMQASLTWLKTNGDIASAGGQRYRIMPVYAVILPASDGNPSGVREIRLCGDLRRDTEILEALAEHGVQRTSEVAERLWKIGDDYVTIPVGIRRWLTVADAQIEDIRKILEETQVPCVDVRELERSLPSVHELKVPPRSAFTVITPTSGHWATYEPRSGAEDRWQSLDTWDDLANGLMRWMPSLDWRGERDSRYFFRGDLESMAELSSSTAALWMFYEDCVADIPRQLWVSERELWLPRQLPDAHRQWLGVITDRIRWHEQQIQCWLSVDATPVVRTIVDTLGLEPVFARPD